MEMGRIHSLESFGTVDGPGTRFVVFAQGCPMRCQYCHNPDTWELSGGNMMSVDEIFEQFERNRPFYENGGITVTGGEPMMQMDFVTALFARAKSEGVHTCLDSSGICFNPDSAEVMKKVDQLLAVTDLVMLDIKHIDPEEHVKLTSQQNKNILAFAKYLDEKHIDVWIRHVVVPGITDNEVYLTRLGEFLATLHNVKALDVLPYHVMGIVKYENLGIDYPLQGVPAMSEKKAVECRDIILKARKRTLLGIEESLRTQSAKAEKYNYIKEGTKMAFKIDDSCISCGACAGACPVGAAAEGDGKFEIDADNCISCGACAGACPVGAISEE